MAIPNEPVLFIKPRTSLNGPFPAKINIPKIAQDDTADYEAELTLILSKDGRDIPESEAYDYVLGYTAGNDVSARAQQQKNSQWCFGKGIFHMSMRLYHGANLPFTGMDGAAPIGPVLVSPSAIPDPHVLNVTATHNSTVVQNTNTRYAPQS